MLVNLLLTKKLFLLISLLGVGVLLLSATLTFYSGKVVFKSDVVKIKGDKASLTTNLSLTEKESPYRILVTVRYSKNGNIVNYTADPLDFIFNLSSQNGIGNGVGVDAHNITFITEFNLLKPDTFDLGIFNITKAGSFSASLVSQIETGWNEDHDIEDISYEIRSNTISLGIIGVGGWIISLFGLLGLVLLVVKEKTAKK